MQDFFQTKVSKIVSHNFRTARVFSKYGIDFCCNGGIPIEEACKLKNVSPQLVRDELELVMLEDQEFDYNILNLSELVNHIVDVHHSYLQETMPILAGYLDKLCKVHGDRHPELFPIQERFLATMSALTVHMKKEELVLFPVIKRMHRANIENEICPNPQFGHIQNPISMMELEHENEGVRLREIAELSNNYKCPSDGCQTYRVTYQMLQDFERDLHLHIHLENNILFPKALELYSEMFEKVKSSQLN